MKKICLIALLVVSGFSAQAQLDQLYATIGVALQEKNAQEVLRIAQQIQYTAPDNYAGPLYKSFGHLMRNNLENAQKELAVAKALNGCDFSIYAIEAYLRFMEGNSTSASQLLNYSFQFSINNGDLQEILKDADLLAHTTARDFEGLKKIATAAAAAQKDGPVLMQMYGEVLAQWQQGKSSPREQNFFNLLKNQTPVNEDFIAFAKAKKALNILLHNSDQAAQKTLETYAKRTTQENQYTRSQAHWYLSLIHI